MRIALVLVALVLAGCAAPTTWAAPAPSPPSTASASPAPSPTPSDIGYPPAGPGTWAVAGRSRPVAGTSGTLLRYRVAVEQGITGITADAFGSQVAAVLGDPRSWTGTGHWRLQLVGAGVRYDFTIYLATPATRDKLCGDGYDRYTSCRNGNSVVLNVARWVQGVPGYGASLDVYREYMVNHETGHRLFHGHELCPGPGRPAPVMQQQTLGLHGCVANPWPIVDGQPYDGRSGEYDDPIPANR
jgi:hypothetical protein